MSIMKNKFVIEVLGDICLSNCDFSDDEINSIASMINDCLPKTDYRIANLEAPFVFSEERAIPKIGPNLCMTKHHCSFFEAVNVDAYTLANNHLGDYGSEGILQTISVLKDLNKKYCGAGEGGEEAYAPLRIDCSNWTISIISICENEFGVTYNNNPGTAGYNASYIKGLLEEEKSEVDFVFVIYHGGNEHYPFPSPGQVDRFHLLADWGADVVIGTHPHCLKGSELYGNSWLIYGIGNFYFPLARETVYDYWGIGIGVQITIDDGIDISTNYYEFDKNGKRFRRLPNCLMEEYYKSISETIYNRRVLERLFDAWAYMSASAMLSYLWDGTLNDTKTRLWWKNLFSCEAHNELIRRYFEMNVRSIIPDDSDKTYIKKTMIRELDNKLKPTEIGEAVVLWGCSKKTEKAICEYKDNRIVLVDRDQVKQELYFMGYPVMRPEDIMVTNRKSLFVICTNKSSYCDIADHLRNNGINNIRFYE